MTLATWLALATICLLGAMSPGPSLVVVLRNTLRGGRGAGLATGLSHGLAVALYALATIAGLSALVSQSTLLFQVIQVAGALYLLYLGAQSLLGPPDAAFSSDPHNGQPQQTAVLEGFLVAFFNPKLAVFMLALFSQFLSADSSWEYRWLMVATAGIIDAGWYSLVALLLSQQNVASRLKNSGVFLQRGLGAILILLALSVLGSVFFDNWG